MRTLMANLSSYWRTLVVRGLVAIAFGIVTFLWPGVTLGAIVLLFAAYALIDGIAGIVVGFKDSQRKWAPLIGGIVSVAAAIITFMNPALTLLALVTLIAIWAVMRGVFDVVAAIRLRREIEGEWLLVLGGVLSIVFGVLVFSAPRAGALFAAWWIGVYAFVLGLVLLACGMKLRSISRRVAAV